MTTNESGDYNFAEVPPGQYRAEFEQAGFKKNIRKDITVEINQVLTLNMAMQLGEAKEIVEVTSEAPLVETTSTQMGAVVNERAVVQLPLNARDTYQLLSLQPGVQSQTGTDLFYGSDRAGVVSVNGGRGRSPTTSASTGVTRTISSRTCQLFSQPRIRSKNSASSPTPSMRNTAATPGRLSTW